MSRRNLTANKRAFRRNNKSFLNMITEAPLTLTIDLGGGPVEVNVSPITGAVTNDEDLPSGATIVVKRDRENVQEQ